MNQKDTLAQSNSFKSTGNLGSDIKEIARGNYDGPVPQRQTEKEIIDFCKLAVPGWAGLPDSVKLETKKFKSGASSTLRKVFLDGSVAETQQHRACVYRFMGNLENKSLKGLKINENFVVLAGDLGISERIYAAKGRHRCTEFCEGEELFAGEGSHFLAAVYEGIVPEMTADNNPANTELMQAVGNAIGTLHNMPLDWISSALSDHEFNECKQKMIYWPGFVEELGLTALGERIRNASSTPKDDWFAAPVAIHTDLHPANMILLKGGLQVRIIDWEGVTMGYRGTDLSYFFLCLAGSTLASRRAFAKGYLAASNKSNDDESIDMFLLNVEKCAPMGLIVNAALATIFNPWRRRPLVLMIERALDILAKEVEGKGAEDVKWIIEQGLVQRLLDEGGANACCCSLM